MFICGRKISDNILLYSEPINKYHKVLNGRKNYAIKVDLMKTFNMVSKRFIIAIMKKTELYPMFIKWIEFLKELIRA